MDSTHMTRSVIPAATLWLWAAASAQGNLIVNWSFENNLAGNSSVYNFDNEQYNAWMSDSTAFGDAQEIDIIRTGSSYGDAPVDGDWKIGIAAREEGVQDAFSLTLSASLVAGDAYDLSFWAQSFEHGAYVDARISIGVSTSADAFGEWVFTTAPIGSAAWGMVSTTFTAPVQAQFLTVRIDLPDDWANDESWAYIDAFTLAGVPAPGAGAMLAALMLAGPRRRRA